MASKKSGRIVLATATTALLRGAAGKRLTDPKHRDTNRKVMLQIMGGLILAALPVGLIAQSTAAPTVSLANLVNTRAIAFKQYDDALASGASAADIKDLADLANSRLADMKSGMESSHLFTEAQIAGVTGENGVAYFDNLIVSINPAQHPELQQIIDQGYEAEYAMIDLRLSQANANSVALERARATLMARQQMWHILFAPPDPNGTGTGSRTTNQPPAAGESGTPELAPNAPAQPTTPQVPQVDPPPQPPSPPTPPPAVRPVRRPPTTNTPQPDPATQVNGARVPVAPPPRTTDPAITIEHPVPTPDGQPTHADPVQLPRTNIPPTPVAPDPASADGQNMPTGTPKPTDDLSITVGKQAGTGAAGSANGGAQGQSAAAAAAAAAAQGAGAPAGNGSDDGANPTLPWDPASSHQQPVNDGSSSGQETGIPGDRGTNLPTPIVLPPGILRPGRVGTTDQSGGDVAAIVTGIDNSGGSSFATGNGIGNTGGSAQSPAGNGAAAAGSIGISLAPIYQNYTVTPGDHGSTVIAVPSTQVRAPTAVITAPTNQVAVTSTQIRVPSTQVNVPSTQVTVPSTQITVPSTQVTVPSTQITVPSTQIVVPSSVMTSLDLQPALCGR